VNHQGKQGEQAKQGTKGWKACWEEQSWGPSGGEEHRALLERGHQARQGRAPWAGTGWMSRCDQRLSSRATAPGAR
jgi:hypothetical protein